MNDRFVLSLVSLTLLMLAPSQRALGQVWTRTSAPISVSSQCLACSADGTRLVAMGESWNLPSGWVTAICTSADFGATWNTQTNVLSAAYYPEAVASSADGSRLFAADDFAIYASTNFGASWAITGAPATNQYRSIASSADGMRLVAAVDWGGIYTSTDGGVSWTVAYPVAEIWSAVASSSNGARLVCAVGPYPNNEDFNSGNIYASADFGASWTQTSAPNEPWTALACSADGTKLAACTGYILNYPNPFYNGSIYVSTNAGQTWTLTAASNAYWTSLAWSADGTKLFAAANGVSDPSVGGICVSTDLGASWKVMTNSSWASIAASADGSRLAAGGGVYVWSSTVPVAYDTPSVMTILAGTNLTLSSPSDISGASPFYYQWKLNGAILDQATNTSITITNFPLADIGTFTLLVSNAFGGILLTNAIVTPVPAFISTYGIGAVSDIDAQLVGSVTPGPSNTLVWFQWGADTNYGNSTPAQSVATGFTSIGFGDTISNLTPNTTYHFRSVASNAFGLVTGGDASFTTLYPPPVITNQPISRVVFAGANVTFAVGADGQGEDVYYQWNSTANLGRVVAGGGTNDPNAGGLATEAEIDDPYILAPDGSGNLFIAADDYNYNTQRIYKVGGDGLISTIVGKNVNYGDGGWATNAILSYAQGIATDASGNLFVADSQNSLIRKVDTNGIITTVAGNGTFGFSGDGGAATNASLYWPTSVAVDSAGNLYIADNNNQLVRKVNATGVITTFAGNGQYDTNTGAGTYSGDGGAATNAGLNQPQAVAVDAEGNVFIADSGNNRIRKIAPSGIITTVAGLGTNAFFGDGGAATNAGLSYPAGVAIDSSGNLFIADTSNFRVRKVTTNGVISTVAGTGNPTNGPTGDGGPATSAELSPPSDVAVDAVGNLYIADSNWGAVRKVDTNGVITTVLTNLSSPRLTTDRAGNLFVSDSDTVLRLDTNGVLTTVAGGGIGVADGGPAANAQFYASGLAADGHGSLFVSDRGHGCVRKVSADGAISTFVGNVGWPAAIAFDTSNNLLIADQASGSILRVGTNGSFTPLAALPGNPSEIATDAAGDVFAFLPNAIINNYSRGAVWRIALDGTVTGILNAGILIPPPSPWGGWAVTASFRHMTADQYGNVFVSYYAYYSGGGQCYECDFAQAGILENGGNLIGPAKWGDYGALATDSANALYYVSGPFVVKRTDTQHSVLTLRSVSTNDAGDYQVTIWGASANSVTSALVSLTVATSPEIYNTIRNSEGSLALSCVSPPGSTNLVQVATNLAPPVLWQTISTNIAGPDGDWQFTDTNTANSPARFYRSATFVGP